uniref:Serine carboxypeptidase-like 17 n=1 Tax=Rhizophora mucronata TaxID=61149 RepID=A0A2P2M3I4_RHIMU
MWSLGPSLRRQGFAMAEFTVQTSQIFVRSNSIHLVSESSENN